MYPLLLGSLIFTIPSTYFLPSIVLQLSALIPYWASYVANKKSGKEKQDLFFDELRTIDSKLADNLEKSKIKPQVRTFSSVLSEIQKDLQTSWHFVKWSLILTLFGILPIVGTWISYFGQVFLIAERYGWDLLSIYTYDCNRMNYSQHHNWLHPKEWKIVGFTLPFVLISSIPFLGPLVFGIAQAAVAHLLVQDLLSVDEKEKARG